uniref:Rhomboid-like protein 12, mitochondrial isoform X1 n=1 Tax=Tanacetum cinerariifolium TaxID=118510 RepID=A0A6L2MU56_TANCI|nr:rhomboid-like protein 12, mitochondrial isoform X1 [Tanacetum cinerariifolium]
MIYFYFHGKKIVHKFGPKILLKLYLAGAIAGSVFFLLERASIKDGFGDSEIGALGASAAVTAIQLLDLFYIPKQKKYSLLKFITYSASILLVETTSEKALDAVRSCNDDVTTYSDGVTIADKKKPLEDSTG